MNGFCWIPNFILKEVFPVCFLLCPPVPQWSLALPLCVSPVSSFPSRIYVLCSHFLSVSSYCFATPLFLCLLGLPNVWSLHWTTVTCASVNGLHWYNQSACHSRHPVSPFKPWLVCVFVHKLWQATTSFKHCSLKATFSYTVSIHDMSEDSISRKWKISRILINLICIPHTVKYSIQSLTVKLVL